MSRRNISYENVYSFAMLMQVMGCYSFIPQVEHFRCLDQQSSYGNMPVEPSLSKSWAHIARELGVSSPLKRFLIEVDFKVARSVGALMAGQIRGRPSAKRVLDNLRRSRAAEQVLGYRKSYLDTEQNAGFGKSLSHHLPLLALTLSRVFSQWLMQLPYGSIDHLSSIKHMARAFRIPTLLRYAIYHSNLLKPSVFSHSQLNDIGMSSNNMNAPIISLCPTELPSPTPKALSYEEAANKCRSDVWAIIKECERINIKFSDPEFDIEQDFASYDHSCLFGIERACDDDDEEQCAKPGSVHRVPWIFENPKFVANDFISDIKQGTCGNCWWLAALASVRLRKQLMEKICVARDEDCAVYGFVFYRNGRWISTVVDDNLYLTEEDFNQDIYDGTGKRAKLYKKQKQTGSEALFFSSCGGANETWVPRLEKAANSPSNIILDLMLGQDLKLTLSLKLTRILS
ncbi:uncharacterized protein FMAN_15476 [Fusarium mangiferae]|uniref:Calpain catalytic domain-containing protein n=1 Tax=Fusarium mangiferae TaxID=192010 RepID=A0A1L7UF70_FUSMA|nr:uncharacterized protein FMAN_15476 [Fusarium mangiferae]CVL09310.1 uncharacterized protein FMAN_15476 [Fusarium mangiferae]